MKLPEKMPIVAPTVIPDLIPVVTEPPPPEPVEIVSDAGVEGGVQAGEEGGEIGGVIAGIVSSLKPKPQPLPDIVEIERDLPLPMGSVSQDFPMYPEFARSRGWEDSLVVRYTIGKNGKVNEVSVVRPPERDDFTRAALAAIKYWRFQPFRDPANGQAKEVVHELTVEFRIVRTRAR